MSAVPAAQQAPTDGITAAPQAPRRWGDRAVPQNAAVACPPATGRGRYLTATVMTGLADRSGHPSG